MDCVALLHAEAGSSPSGTGSFTFFCNFSVVVANLAFVKSVGIWGHVQGSESWSFFPCSFLSSVPGNGEIWAVHLNETRIDQFAVKYDVLGMTCWDNNAGANYTLDVVAGESTDGVGTAVVKPNVMAVSSLPDGAGHLVVDVLVKNLAFSKQVAIVYTTNNWVSSANAFGEFLQSFRPPSTPHQINAELWQVTAPTGMGNSGQYAAFYSVDGNTFWDNNFSQNYSF